MNAQEVSTAIERGEYAAVAEAFVPLVTRHASDFHKKTGQDFDDLRGAGFIGLMRAVTKFDPAQSSFAYYASFWIKAFMLKFCIDNHSLVKLGTTQAQRRLFYSLTKTRAKMAVAGEDVSCETIAEALGCEVGEVEEMISRMDGGTVSLDVASGEDSDPLIQNFPTDPVTPEIIEHSASLRRYITEIMGYAGLTPREKDVLTRRFLDDSDTTLREIGEDWGCTRERVRQVEAKAIEKLRWVVGRDIDPDDITWR